MKPKQKKFKIALNNFLKQKTPTVSQSHMVKLIRKFGKYIYIYILMLMDFVDSLNYFPRLLGNVLRFDVSYSAAQAPMRQSVNYVCLNSEFIQEYL